MLSLSLTEKEAELLRKSITHCLATCKEGGARTAVPTARRLRNC
jgi:hypothetical protein